LIAPNSKEDERVKISSPTKTVPIKAYVQELILKTLLGFVSTLKDIPEDLEDSEIEIIIEPK